MADLDLIAEMLRRQRHDLEDSMEQTATRSVDAAQLIEKIEDLRRRSQETQQQFPQQPKTTHADGK